MLWKTVPFTLLLVTFLFIACESSSEDKLPEEQELYLFPFKSEVDAGNLGCGYTNYELVGDWLKKRIRRSVPHLSTNDLIALGETYHEEHIPYPLTEHPRGAWAREIVENMKPYLVENAFPYTVYVVETPVFNAFTIPGGNIYVTTGLLESVSNKDELAYIIGHELGHNENDHTKELARLYLYVQQQQEDGDFFSLTSALLTQVASSICGKPDELECDIASVYLLYQAGYDPEKALGGIDLLRKVSGPAPDDDWRKMIAGFFQSHPWSEDRDRCVTSYVKNAKVIVACEDHFEGQLGVVSTKSSPLNIWEYPSKSAEKLFPIPKGGEVEVICDAVPQPYRTKRDWYYVEYIDQGETYRGWVDQKYVELGE